MLFLSTVLGCVAICFLLILVGVVMYQKGSARRKLRLRSKRIRGIAMSLNQKFDTRAHPNDSLGRETHNTTSTNTIQLHDRTHIKVWPSSDSDEENGSPVMFHRSRVTPRADSVLISEFEVDYIRQIQRFLLFPILNPLSEKFLHSPKIEQVCKYPIWTYITMFP